MPEILQNKTIFSLLEVTQSIQKTLAERYKNAFWVKAEMNKLNLYSHTGHCYPELVEKQNGKIIAQVKSNLWKADYQRINELFLQVLKEPLKDGIKILFLGRISFDPQYGLSLRIIDIDPSYTLGDIEKEKQETISRLHEENIFYKNKKVKLSLLPKRVAVISVETSKGYADFAGVIENNLWGYAIKLTLFPSLLQGDKAISSIKSQLKKIKKLKSSFDVVAIIRGGGGDVGLSCYNSYELAKEIAMFPLPVITGIGHATNETVTEMISFQNAITPTKIAEFLLQEFHNFSVPVHNAEDKIMAFAKGLLKDERTGFLSTIKLFKSVTANHLNRNKNNLKGSVDELSSQSGFIFKSDTLQLLNVKLNLVKQSNELLLNESKSALKLAGKLPTSASLYFKNEENIILGLEKNIRLMDPVNVLKRGYSITKYNGVSVNKASGIKVGDEIETVLAEGILLSTVKTINSNEEDGKGN